MQQSTQELRDGLGISALVFEAEVVDGHVGVESAPIGYAEEAGKCISHLNRQLRESEPNSLESTCPQYRFRSDHLRKLAFVKDSYSVAAEHGEGVS